MAMNKKIMPSLFFLMNGITCIAVALGMGILVGLFLCILNTTIFYQLTNNEVNT